VGEGSAEVADGLPWAESSLASVNVGKGHIEVGSSNAGECLDHLDCGHSRRVKSEELRSIGGGVLHGWRSSFFVKVVSSLALNG
jgi:hypothetical protein